MKWSKNIEKYYLLLLVILFFISYWIFWPYSWMITDSHSYASQALAFASGNKEYAQFDFLLARDVNLIRSPYSLGNASYLAVFVIIFGKKGLFVASLLAVMLTAIILGKTLRLLQYSSGALSLMFISPIVLFFARSLMSGLVSMLIVSMFLYVFFGLEPKRKRYLLLGFLAGISMWFRETNILLLAPFCIYEMFKKSSSLLPLMSAGIAGLAFKFISSYWVYGDLWFVSASAGFSIKSLFQNFPVYLFILLGLIPGGIAYAIFYSSKTERIFKLSIAFFVVTYLLYNYTAVEYSGFLRGGLLTGRFMLPIIPFLVIALGEIMSRKKWLANSIRYILVPLSLIMIPVSQYGFSMMYKPHEEAARKLAHQYADFPLVFDQSGFTNIIRYINPVTADWKVMSDINNLSEPALQAKLAEYPSPVFIVLSRSIESIPKQERSSEVDRIIESLPSTFVEKIVIDNQNYLEVRKIASKNIEIN